MYCPKCGKKLEEDWKICPGCGWTIATDEGKIEPKSEKKNEEEKVEEKVEGRRGEESGRKEEFTIGNTKIKVHILLKILAIIAMVCYFCPLYLVSCSGTELFSLAGPDITFGFYYMDEEMGGYLPFAVTLLFPIISFFLAFAGKKDGFSEDGWRSGRRKSYICASCFGAVVLFIWNYSAALSSNTAETPIQVEWLFALYLTVIANLAGVVLAAYLAFLYEKKLNAGKQSSVKSLGVKTAGKAFGGSVALFLLVLILMAASEETVDEEIYNMEQEEGYNVEQGEDYEENLNDYPDPSGTDNTGAGNITADQNNDTAESGADVYGSEGQPDSPAEEINFIGMSGTYQCGSSLEAGVIDIAIVDGSTVSAAFGTYEMPALIGGTGGGITGMILDSNTVEIDLGAGCIFTLTWSDTGVFTITRTGSSGYPEIDAVTDGMEYVNAQYYQVS